MNPKECKVEKIHLGDSRKIKFGVVIPIFYDHEKQNPLRLRFPAEMKIFDNKDWKSFSLFCDFINKDDLKKFQEIKDHILKLANDEKPRLQILHPRFAKFQALEFSFLKGGKLWAKLETKSLRYFTARFWKKKTGGFMSKFTPQVGDFMTGEVIVTLKQIFLGNRKASEASGSNGVRPAITCVVDEALIEKTVQPPSLFDEFVEEDPSEESDSEELE